MGKKDKDDIEAINRDQRHIEIARRRWEETANIDDDAVIFMAQIREDVEQEG